MNKEQQFMESLYEECYKELDGFEVARNKTKNEIFQLIGYAIVSYGSNIKGLKSKRYIITSVLNMLTKDKEEVEEFLKTQLMINADKVCDFYGYKLSKREKQEVINRVFAGLTYKDRKRQHDEVLKNKTHRLLFSLIIGKVTLDKTQHNKKAFTKLTDKVFNSYVKSINGILISEITRIRNDIFLRENKGKRVRYCSVLERNTCADCSDLDGEVFLADEVEDLIPQHRSCKCYWIKVED